MEKMSLRDIGLMYDEQFNKKMEIAKFLLKNLGNKKEIQLATKWLIRVSNIKSADLEVKKNRNAFLSYVVKVLRDGVLRGCLESEPDLLCDPDNSLAFLDYPDEFTGKSAEEILKDTVNQPMIQFHSKWSEDHRTYVAVKPIPGRGALVYMAVSKKPGMQNWDLPSLKKAPQD
ncbi:uncharacterized protein [Neodiprion pinetum]|uniref:Uncharacterized protein LOC107225258 n=1 Tax=Neodiprion lecontei TaxID=441921 RepID=A0A6J0C3P6_NEOLC|nr:uncharacterized protein LOC107225258 [Neodiprion lecontei]XP_046465780.1 uncharacterized protein LOC124211101 [Neodiprion pinetum]